MVNKTLTLFKMQMIQELKLNILYGDKNSKEKKRFILLFFTFLLLGGLLIVYSYGMGVNLVQLKLTALIPAYGLVISVLLIFFFTLFKSNGIIFGTKNNDFLMSLPLKFQWILSSRFLSMYCMNLVAAALIMMPMGIVYATTMNTSYLVYLIWGLGIVITPLLPTTFATIIGAIIVWGASKFKYSNALATIGSLILFIGLFIGSFLMNQSNNAAILENGMSDLSLILGSFLNRIYPIAQLFSRAVIMIDFGALFIFVGLSVIIYIGFIFILSTQFKRINTALTSRRTLSNYALGTLKNSSTLKTLYKKELKRFFSSTIYVINLGLGSIILLLMSVGVLFVDLDTIITIIPLTNVEQLLEQIIPFAIAGILGMSCTTTVALSMEGENIWILKSLPVDEKTIYNSKILVNLTLLLPTAIISSIVMTIKFSTTIMNTLLIILIPLIYSFFIAVWGMLIDTKFQTYDWSSETAMVKQSINSLAGLLSLLAIGLLPIVMILFIQPINPTVFSLIYLLLITLLTLLLYQRLEHRAIVTE